MPRELTWRCCDCNTEYKLSERVTRCQSIYCRHKRCSACYRMKYWYRQDGDIVKTPADLTPEETEEWEAGEEAAQIREQEAMYIERATREPGRRRGR